MAQLGRNNDTAERRFFFLPGGHLDLESAAPAQNLPRNPILSLDTLKDTLNAFVAK